MRRDETGLLELLNGSGFPFQIGVRGEIERTTETHGWRIDAEEHFWRHPKTGDSGFIDLVSSHGDFIFTILIECKRVKERGEWLFLMPRKYAGEKRRISALCARSPGGEPADPFFVQSVDPFFVWCDFDFDPISPEASYCVFRGQDEKKPMLERIADDLLPAVEGVGVEEKQLKLGDRTSGGDWRLFLPVIVTNATLYTSSFDADKVDMSSGRLPEGTCEFSPVPFVRFRKSLATYFPGTASGSYGNSLSQASRLKERTVLVVNSAALADSLKLLRVSSNGGDIFGRKLHSLYPARWGREDSV